MLRTDKPMTTDITKAGSLALLLAAAGLAACSTTKEPPATAPAASQLATEYQIGPGDSLSVFVWGNPDLSVEARVRPDGMVTTPLAEDVRASGKTPSELARDIEARLAQYVRNPRVTVRMVDFVGITSAQVRVVGAAVSPQAIPYRQGMTVLDVMIAVGGLSEFAAGNRAKLVREQSGTPVKYRIRLDDLLNDGDVTQNVAVLPGDVIVIPETRF
jgi:polysaccharide export outer membrane protein